MDGSSRKGLVIAAIALVATGCGKTRTSRFTDTEGRAFAVTCKSGSGKYDDRCKVTAAFASKPTGQSPPGTHGGFEVAHTETSRYVTVCEAWFASDGHFMTGDDYDCRAIPCRSDADCPESPLLEHPSCLNGLCGDPQGLIDANDAMALCLAGTGRWIPSDEQHERASAVSTVQTSVGCGHTTACKVPPACRQP